jgi:hypothetical protein
MSDTQLLDFLESLFSGKFRNSLFIGHDLPTFGDSHQMINLDIRSQIECVHRAKTVRGAIKLAIKEAKAREDESHV